MYIGNRYTFVGQKNETLTYEVRHPSDCCLTSGEQFFSRIMASENNYLEVCILLRWLLSQLPLSHCNLEDGKGGGTNKISKSNGITLFIMGRICASFFFIVCLYLYYRWTFDYQKGKCVFRRGGRWVKNHNIISRSISNY